jgi:prohibitin 2
MFTPMRTEQPNQYSPLYPIVRYVLPLLAVVALLICSFHVVPSGHRGVEREFGDVSPRVLPEGLHILKPWTKVTDYDVTMTASQARGAQGGTKDQQVVHTDINMNWSFDPSKVNYTLNHFGRGEYIDSAFVQPALFEVFKAVTAEFSSQELLTKRAQVSSEIVSKMQAKLNKYNIIVSDINIINFGFSPGYQTSIEEKQIESQRAEKAAYLLARATTEAQQAIVVAKGKAEAIKVEAEAINNQGGDTYVKMKAIEKWNGVMPTTIVGGSTATPIFNVK